MFAGFYNNNLLIVHPELPFEFFTDTQSNTEKLFTQVFPGNEIAILIENSTASAFGYAIINNGKKIRMKDGSDGDIYHDEGELLPEEKEILSEQIFEDDDLEEMRENEMSEEEIEEMIKFEASWRVPDRLSIRFLGEAVSSIDTEKVSLTMYE